MTKPTDAAALLPRKLATDANTILLGILVAIASGYFLRHTYMVTMPVACSFFFFCLVRPIQRFVDKRLPDRYGWVGLSAAALWFMLLFAACGWAVWLCAQMAVKLVAQYTPAIAAQWKELGVWAVSNGVPFEQVTAQSDTVRNSLHAMFAAGFSSVWQGLGAAVLIFFLVVLMLLEARAWRRKSRVLFSTPKAIEVIETVRTISQKLRVYMWLRTGISFVTGLVSWLWLEMVGIPDALFLGVLIFGLNYIPYLGSNLAVIPPALVGWAALGSWGAWLAIIGLGIIQQIAGNVVEPRLQGRILDLSPLVIFVAMLYWWWVWGIIGAILAVPMTVILAMVCHTIEPLKPIAVFIGSPPADRRFHTGYHAAVVPKAGS